MRMTWRLTSAAFAVATALVSHTASAQTEDTAVNRAGGMVGAVAGLGIGTCTGCGAGFGFGVEGGYTCGFHLYVGANFTYELGKVNSWLFEPQVGYDLALFGDLPILLRPYVGLGYESFSIGSAASGSCANSGDPTLCQSLLNSVSTSFGGFVISPGALATYAITPHIYAGADLRFDIGTASGFGGVTINILAAGGYRF